MQKKKESNFEFFNPNPKRKKMYKTGAKAGKYPKWDVGDCTIRAVAGATGLSWMEVFNGLVEEAREIYDVPTSVEAAGRFLEKHGFVKKSLGKVEYGGSRLTASELAKLKSNARCVFRLASHLVCAFDGKYHDVWDCGARTVYFYWEKVS